MEYNYDGSHSITFGPGTFSGGRLQGKNTWADWWLIPSERPDIAEPGIKTKFVQIPGREDPIDLTDWLTGEPVMTDRSGSWEFIIDNSRPGWMAVRDTIVDYLHGKQMKCVLEDDPNYYYDGRFTVRCASGEKNSAVTISYQVRPTKQRIGG